VKKFIAIIAVVLSSALFMGCSNVPADETIAFPWRVVLGMQFSLSHGTSDTAVQSMRDFLDSEIGERNITHQVSMSTEHLRVDLNFSNYRVFREFFALSAADSDLEVVELAWEASVFFRTRAYTFDNPWKLVVDNARISAIETQVQTLFATTGTNVLRRFELQTSFRRRVEVHSGWNRSPAFYQYFFNFGGENSIPTITIEDRFENAPIWYLIAAIAAVIFMVILYFLLKKREKSL